MIVGQAFADSAPDLTGLFCAGLRQNDGKLIATIPRGRIYRPAGKAKNISQAAERPIACQMTITVIDLLHAVQIKRQHSKGRPVRSERLISDSSASLSLR